MLPGRYHTGWLSKTLLQFDETNLHNCSESRMIFFTVFTCEKSNMANDINVHIKIVWNVKMNLIIKIEKALPNAI